MGETCRGFESDWQAQNVTLTLNEDKRCDRLPQSDVVCGGQEMDLDFFKLRPGLNLKKSARYKLQFE